MFVLKRPLERLGIGFGLETYSKWGLHYSLAYVLQQWRSENH